MTIFWASEPSKSDVERIIQQWRDAKKSHPGHIILFQRKDGSCTTYEVDAITIEKAGWGVVQNFAGKRILSITPGAVGIVVATLEEKGHKVQIVTQKEEEEPMIETKEKKKKPKKLIDSAPPATEAGIKKEDQSHPELPTCSDMTEDATLKWLEKCSAQGDHPRLLAQCPHLCHMAGANPARLTRRLLEDAVLEGAEEGFKAWSKLGFDCKDIRKLWVRCGLPGQLAPPDPHHRTEQEEVLAQKVVTTVVGKIKDARKAPQVAQDASRQQVAWEDQGGESYARQDGLGRVHRILPVPGSANNSYKLLIDGQEQDKKASKIFKLGSLKACQQQSLDIEQADAFRQQKNVPGRSEPDNDIEMSPQENEAMKITHTQAVDLANALGIKVSAKVKPAHVQKELLKIPWGDLPADHRLEDGDLDKVFQEVRAVAGKVAVAEPKTEAPTKAAASVSVPAKGKPKKGPKTTPEAPKGKKPGKGKPKAQKPAKGTTEPTSKPTKEKKGKTNPGEASRNGKPGVVSAAVRVLTESQEPMSLLDVYNQIVAKGYWVPTGGAPMNSMRGGIYGEIAKKGDQSRFVKVDKGLYTVKK